MIKLGDIDISKIYLGETEITKAYIGDTEVYGSSEPTQPNNEIWYTSTDGNVVAMNATAVDLMGTFVSNTYENGKGVIKYQDDITTIPYGRGGIINGNYIVADGIFAYSSNLATMSLPSTVRTIGNYAFRNSNKLISIDIPKEVTSIGGYAFSNCSLLEKINIPSGITSINGYTFQNCTSLTNIEIPTSVKTIANYAFNGCSNLSTITYNSTKEQFKAIISADTLVDYLNADTLVICSDGEATLLELFGIENRIIRYTSTDGNIVTPYSATSIGTIVSNTYENGQGEMVFSKKITSLSTSAFQNRTTLTTIEIPSGVTSIGQNAFRSCSKLTRVTIPSGVTSIGASAFTSCSGLTEVAFEEGSKLTSIGSCAFASAKTLTAIDIPSGVTSIGTSAFTSCNLREIALPDKLTSISDGLFHVNRSMSKVNIGDNSKIKTIGSTAFRYCDGVSEINIPSGVTSIGNQAFESTKLYTLNIPSGCTSIGSGLPSSIDEIVVDPRNTVYSSDGNCLMKGTTLIKGTNTSIIPDYTTSIGARAFSSINSLTAIDIPSGVTSIGERGFAWCSSLTSIDYNDTSTQFTSITKGSDWKYNVPSTCIVHCTDGDFAISNFS